MDATSQLVMRLAADGLREPQSVVNYQYAAGLLPQPYRSGWEESFSALTAYYEDRSTEPFAWEECATKAMKLYHSNVTRWVNESGAVAIKGCTDKRVAVERLNASRYQTDFNCLSPAEQSWFVPLDTKHDWLKQHRTVHVFFKKMGLVMFRMSPVDQLEPFEAKMRAVTAEWLEEALRKEAA